MSFIDVTFERDATVLKTVAKISAGWESKKFYGHQLVDYKYDIKLSVKVWITASRRIKDFPTDLAGKHEEDLIRSELANSRLTVYVPLEKELRWTKTDTGKPQVDWHYVQLTSDSNQSFHVQHMIVFNPPQIKKGDYWDWKLLPFLSGGLLESNRRRH
jgi:hypothetical protein